MIHIEKKNRTRNLSYGDSVRQLPQMVTKLKKEKRWFNQEVKPSRSQLKPEEVKKLKVYANNRKKSGNQSNSPHKHSQEMTETPKIGA